MKEHGLMFKGPLVRMLLKDLKTQTRRMLGTFYEPGDRIYVKETWQKGFNGDVIYRADCGDEKLEESVLRSARRSGITVVPWKSSMLMPKRVARIWLEITDARVERLNNISREDAIAEGLAFVADGGSPWGVPGMPTTWHGDPRESYRQLWETINGIGSWALNPEVRVITFRRIDT